jgi:hypothetical protein
MGMKEELKELRQLMTNLEERDVRFVGAGGWMRRMVLQGYSGKEITRAVAALIDRENAHGRSILHVFPYLQKALSERREEMREKKRIAEHQRILEEERRSSPEFIKAAKGKLQVMFDFLDHKLTRKQYLEWMWKMHVEEPDYGWDTEAKKLERFYDKRHLI